MAGCDGNPFTVYADAIFCWISYAGAILRLRTAALSDHRITLIKEVVTGIRAIKTNAWEDEYRKKIKNVRR